MRSVGAETSSDRYPIERFAHSANRRSRFDPERDTEDVLRTYAGEQGVDLDAGNWHFLRPAQYDVGKEIVSERFGLPLEKRPAEDYENLEYMFPHYSYVFLVNAQGIVERVYPNGATRDASRVVDDFETVATA